MLRASRVATILLGAPLLLGMGACADLARVSGLAPAPVDAKSPVAAQVREAAQRNYPYPSFRDVPPRPADVRPPAAWKAAVVDELGERRALTSWTAANPPMTNDTQAFVNSAREEIPPSVLIPLDPTTPEATAAFAERLRQEAAPPPPPK